jgi:hypothetical protein
LRFYIHAFAKDEKSKKGAAELVILSKQRGSERQIGRSEIKKMKVRSFNSHSI